MWFSKNVKLYVLIVVRLLTAKLKLQVGVAEMADVVDILAVEQFIQATKVVMVEMEGMQLYVNHL